MSIAAIKFTLTIIFTILLLLESKIILAGSQAEFEQNISFHSFNATGFRFVSTFDDNQTLLESCDPEQNFTFIIHGHSGSIREKWASLLIGNYSQTRGGCIFFMNYARYGNENYFLLVSKFNNVRKVASRKLMQLYELGFNPDNAHLFGFSFGAHIVLETGYQFYKTTGQRIARVDACDPAGPAFPRGAASVRHAKDSAQVVQCIHTSCGHGTCERYCPYDVNMGYCGHRQAGQYRNPIHTSHIMCPTIFTLSFNTDFTLVPKPSACSVALFTTDPSKYLSRLPTQVMGFRFNTSLPHGSYFSPTCERYPWNYPSDSDCFHVS